jgi:hypothetical protein
MCLSHNQLICGQVINNHLVYLKALTIKYTETARDLALRPVSNLSKDVVLQLAR